MPRITIKPHHSQYLQLISDQMGCSESTALDYLIFELRRQNFSFSSPLATPTAPLLTPQPAGAYVAFQEAVPSSNTILATNAVPEDDEIVRKFAALLEEF